MKAKVIYVLVLLVSFMPACIPLPPPPPSPTLAVTPIMQTPTETPSFTPVETFTPTDTPTATLTETGTETPSATNTETSTPTFTITPTPSPTPVSIPALLDWDAGVLAFSHGPEGSWDHFLWGGFANSLIKKGDTYYLYYQGSPSYDNQCESVANRAIGVATSTDGIQWTKYANNPVITWSSQGSVEEGAASSAAWLGTDGKIYLYYGANTGTGCTVNANVRLAVSEDGFHFQDMGVVLSGQDPILWGSGDEIFSIGAYSYENQWNVYYTPNGVPLSRFLGVASGGSPTTFTQSAGVNNSTIPAWGPVSVVLQDSNAVLVTNPIGPGGPIQFYRFDARKPSVAQADLSYILPNCSQASAIYESGTNHWMISCRDQSSENYYIRNAFPP